MPINFESNRFLQNVEQAALQFKGKVSKELNACSKRLKEIEIGRSHLPKSGCLKEGLSHLCSLWPSKLTPNFQKVSVASVFHKNIGKHFVKGDVKAKDPHAELMKSMHSDARKAMSLLEKNATGSELVEKMGIMRVKDQIEFLELATNVKIQSKTISAEDGEKIKQQLTNLKALSKSAEFMAAGKVPKRTINELIIYRLKMREGEDCLSGHFPEKLEIKDLDEGILVDEHGKEFGSMRETTKIHFAKFCNDNGGDFEMITRWHKDQAGRSESPASLAVAATMLSILGDKPNQYWWKTGFKKDKEQKLNGAENELNASYVLASDEVLEKYKTFKEYENAFKTSLKCYMAYNMEFLAHTEMEGVDKKSETMIVFRTVTPEAMEANGIDYKTAKPGEQFSAKRRVAESGSFGKPVVADGEMKAHAVAMNEKLDNGLIATISSEGPIGTAQVVPFHNILANWMLKPLLIEKGKPANKEKEIYFLTRNVTFAFCELDATTMPKKS